MEYTGVTPLQSAAIVTAAWLGFSLLQILVLFILPLGLKFFRGIYKDANILCLPLLTACLYVIAEWVQSWFLSGLTWAKLSVAQYKNLFFIQSLSLFGTYFVSFIIIFINAAIALYILNKKSKIDVSENFYRHCGLDPKSRAKPLFEIPRQARNDGSRTGLLN